MRIYPAFQIWVYFHLGSCAGQIFIYKNENGLVFWKVIFHCVNKACELFKGGDYILWVSANHLLGLFLSVGVGKFMI